jgi:hypothetical protein
MMRSRNSLGCSLTVASLSAQGAGRLRNSGVVDADPRPAASDAGAAASSR